MSYCRIGRLGNSSITFSKPRNVFGIDGGPQPSGFRFIGTADYKDTGTLKSCHKEFRLIPPVRLLIKKQICKQRLSFAICFFFFINDRGAVHCSRPAEYLTGIAKCSRFSGAVLSAAGQRSGLARHSSGFSNKRLLNNTVFN